MCVTYYVCYTCVQFREGVKFNGSTQCLCDVTTFKVYYNYCLCLCSPVDVTTGTTTTQATTIQATTGQPTMPNSTTATPLTTPRIGNRRHYRIKFGYYLIRHYVSSVIPTHNLLHNNYF